MKKLVVIFIALLALACGRVSDPRLLRAEALMDSLPESALCIVQAIDTAALRGDANRALYGLLLTQGCHKCDIPATDDSLITAAARYLAHHGTPRRAMLARFYQAAVQYNAGQYADAIKSALIALSFAENQSDSYWQGRCYEVMADSYLASLNMDASANNYLKAAQLYNEIGNHTNAGYAYVYAARAMQHGEHPEEALELLNNTYISPKDSTLLGFWEDAHALSYSRMCMWHKALEHWHNAQQYWTDADTLYIDWCNLVKIYVNLNNKKEADIALNKAEKYYHSVPEILHTDYLYYRSAGDTARAMYFLEELNKLSNKETSAALNHSLAFVERDYYNELSVEQSNRNTELRYLLWCILFISALLIFSLALLWRFQTLRKQASLESSMQETRILAERIQTMQAELSHSNAQISQSQSVITKLLKTHFSTLDKLSKDYYETRITDKQKTGFYNDFEQELKRLGSPEAMEELISLINECVNNIISKYRVAFPKAKEAEIYFIALLIAGLSAKTSCQILNIKSSSYYSKLSRIKDKINNTDITDKELFLQYICL